MERRWRCNKAWAWLRAVCLVAVGFFYLKEVIWGGGLYMFAALILTCPQVCVKMCDPAKGAAGQKTIAVLLPCLLDKGIVSTVAEVRSLRLVLHHVDSLGVRSWFAPKTPSLFTWVAECSLCLKWQVAPQKSFPAEFFFQIVLNSRPENSVCLLGVCGLSTNAQIQFPAGSFFSPCTNGKSTSSVLC